MQNDSPHIVATYGKYIVVGAIVGVLVVMFRELISMLMPSDSSAYYALSVALAYAFGIAASYLGNSKISFGHINQRDKGHTATLTTFAMIALFGLGCTTIVSVAIRQSVAEHEVFGDFGDAFAFAISAFIVSVATFTLNSRFTFSED